VLVDVVVALVMDEGVVSVDEDEEDRLAGRGRATLALLASTRLVI